MEIWFLSHREAGSHLGELPRPLSPGRVVPGSERDSFLHQGAARRAWEGPFLGDVCDVCSMVCVCRSARVCAFVCRHTSAYVYPVCAPVCMARRPVSPGEQRYPL